MRRVYLLGCSDDKLAKPAPAKDLYTSERFRAARKLAEQHGDAWFIVSGLHGLLHPEDEVDPYDTYLLHVGTEELTEWRTRFQKQVKDALNAEDRITILASSDYTELISAPLQEMGFDLSLPLEGLKSTRQLRWLTRRRRYLRRLDDLSRFYHLLDRLAKGQPGKVPLEQADGSLAWPKRGVYFFFEQGETRQLDREDSTSPRVVRVGTHAVSKGSSSRLWTRIRTHRGTRSGSGNHRSSVFRLHVGEAIMNQEGITAPSWGEPSPDEIHPNEEQIEALVSEHMRRMDVLVVRIPDEPGPESDRAYIEQNAIGLLSSPSMPTEEPSRDWLGRHSSRHRIRESGLWNLDYVQEDYDPRFLEVLMVYVEVTLGKREPPECSIAPTRPRHQRGLEEFVEGAH